jgi:hypothetical protein
MVAQAYNPSYCGDGRKKDLKVEASLGKGSEILYQKQNKNKRAGGMAQVVECLPSRHRPGFNTEYHQKQTKQKQKNIIQVN